MDLPSIYRKKLAAIRSGVRGILWRFCLKTDYALQTDPYLCLETTCFNKRNVCDPTSSFVSVCSAHQFAGQASLSLVSSVVEWAADGGEGVRAWDNASVTADNTVFRYR